MTIGLVELDRHLRGVRGQIVLPDADGYEQARAVWNGTVDRRPAAIVRCSGTQDVVASLRAAQELGLPLAVRGGGHSLPGFSTVDAGLVIDLARMCQVTVDAERRVATVGGGARWADVDPVTHAQGLATTGGLVSTTGVGGLTLGGGIGWLTRWVGLACDNLLGATLVTAAGDVVRVDGDSDPELLWALRGGGGNFGVVTEFSFQLHPLRDVTGGLFLWPADRAGVIGAAYRAWVDDLPDVCTSMLVSLTAPVIEEIPAQLRGRPAIAVALCHVGSETDAEADLAPLRALSPVELAGRQPYPELQTMFDADLPAGRRYYFSGVFLAALSESVVDTVVDAVDTSPSAGCEIDLHHMGGAAGRVSPEATAFSGRAAPFIANVYACWDESSDDETHRAWVRRTVAALQPHAMAGAYVNFAGDAASADGVRHAYGEDRYERLLQVKRRLDPENLFRLNQNIEP